MKDNATRIELLKQLFDTHPDTKILYLTSDNEAFFEQNDAENYAKQLDDDTVTPEKRPAKIAVVAEAKVLTEAQKNAQADADALKAEKTEVNARYEELFGKKPTGKKFEDIKKIIADKEAEIANANKA